MNDKQRRDPLARPLAPSPQPLAPSHDFFMRAALDQARRAMAADEVPVGAVIVHDGRIIAARTISVRRCTIRRPMPR